MKKKIISLMIAVLAAGAFVSCSDWTEPEARDFTQHKPASYYENLRAWKADKSHPIAFGWFGGWDPTGATTATSLMGIPDSVSLVANWATFSLTPEQMEEVVQVKKLKGTDVVVTILLTNVGAKATPEEVTAGVEDTLGLDGRCRCRPDRGGHPQIRQRVGRRGAQVRLYGSRPRL